MNDHQRAVVQAVTILGEAFRQKVTDTTIRAYELGLADIEPQAIECGLAMALRDSQFMPTVHEFRKLCGVIPVEGRATLAWAAAKKAVREHDYTKSVDFDDSTINAVIRLMGGWENFCNIECGEKFDVWTRKQFEETYLKLHGSRLSDDMTRPLCGFHERSNSSNGLITRDKELVRIETGLPVGPKRITKSKPTAERLQLTAGIGDMP